MKKHLKSIISLLLAFVLFATALPLSEISASAAEKLSSSVTYKKDGTAVVELKAGDFYNAVRYTTDGSVPTKKSKYYFMPFEVTEKTLIRVAEFDGDEKVAGIKLTVDPENAGKKSDDTPASSTTTTTPSAPAASTEKTGKVTFEVTQLGDYKAVVEIECETPGCEIRYTTDGSKPDENSKLYEDGIIVTEKTKIRARAYKEGYKTATTYAKTVNVKLFADSESAPVQTNVPEETPKVTEPEQEETKQEEEKKPEVSVPAEKVYANQKIAYKVTYLDNGTTRVTLTPARNGYTIKYTVDGSTPTYKTGKKYNSRIIIDEPTVIRARQYNSKGQCVGTIKLNAKIKCADVKFECTDISVGTKTIRMSCETPGAQIYFTINGNTPDAEFGQLYTGETFVGDMTTLKAIAVKDNYIKSSINCKVAYEIPLTIEDIDYYDPKFVKVAEIVNQYRLGNGVAPLKLDKELTEAANVRARELLIIMDHQRPVGGYYTTVFPERGITVGMNTELIATYYTSEQELVDTLLENASNKSIIQKNYNYNSIGVGYHEYGKSRYWVILVAEKY